MSKLPLSLSNSKIIFFYILYRIENINKYLIIVENKIYRNTNNIYMFLIGKHLNSLKISLFKTNNSLIYSVSIKLMHISKIMQ